MPQVSGDPSVGTARLAKGEEDGVRSGMAVSGEASLSGTREDVRDFASSLWRGAWSRETWTPGACVRLAVSFVVLATCSWLGIMLSHQSEGVATIWLSNGILFGLLITQPRQRWLGYFVVGLMADTLADVVYGDPFKVAIGVSLANSVEVITSSLVLTWWFGWPLNLSKRRPLIG